jgi:hypothetical protein
MSAQQEKSKGLEYYAGLGGLTAIGLIVYAILRSSYWSFYSRFGVTPEEVGLGYIDTLTRSAPTLFLGITIIVGANAFLAYQVFAIRGQWLWRVVGLTLAFLLMSVSAAGPSRAQTLAGVVEQGIPVHPRSLFELIAVQVDYVTLVPKERPTTGQQASRRPLGQVQSDGIEARTSLMYFGQSNQIAVFYDHTNRQVIRVPIGDVTMLTQ